MKGLNHYEAIRLITGIFEEDLHTMATRLSLANLVARNALGLATDDFTDQKMEEIGITMLRGEPTDAEKLSWCIEAFEATIPNFWESPLGKRLNGHVEGEILV